MNRRNFVQATGALAVASLVPSLASAFPMPVDERWAVAVKFVRAKPVGRFMSYTPKHGIISDRISARRTPGTKICITADHGYVFISDGRELRKKEFPLLWNNLKGAGRREHYSTGPDTFRLPRMQYPWVNNYNIDLPVGEFSVTIYQPKWL